LDALTLHRWLNEGHVHFQLSENSGLAICWNTLSAQLEKQRETSNAFALQSLQEPTPPSNKADRATAKDTKAHSSRRFS